MLGGDGAQPAQQGDELIHATLVVETGRETTWAAAPEGNHPDAGSLGASKGSSRVFNHLIVVRPRAVTLQIFAADEAVARRHREGRGCCCIESLLKKSFWTVGVEPVCHRESNPLASSGFYGSCVLKLGLNSQLRKWRFLLAFRGARNRKTRTGYDRASK